MGTKLDFFGTIYDIRTSAKPKVMVRFLLFICCTLFFAFPSHAHFSYSSTIALHHTGKSVATVAFDLPGTEIYLFDLNTSNGFSLSNKRNITNKAGYQNQPSFDEESTAILYTGDMGSQTDIFRYHISTQKTTQLTKTVESEFSPLFMPDKKHFSVVRVEQDSAQRVWQFNLDGSAPLVHSKKVKDIGYHCWIGSNMFALFMIQQPQNALHISVIGAKTSNHVLDGIGRCMHKVPGKSELSFTKVDKAGKHTLATMNIYTHEVKTHLPMMGNQQDFAWLPDRSVIMTHQNKLYRFQPGKSGQWEAVHTFSDPAFQSLSRIAISPDGSKLALVVAE